MIHFILSMLLVMLGALSCAAYACRRKGWVPRGIIAGAAAILVIAGLIAFYAFQVEPYSLIVTRTSIDIDGLEEQIRIVFLADHHLDVTPRQVLEASVGAANSEDPDYIFLGGDFVSGYDDIPELSLLGNLSAKKGVYAVLGNHDYLLDDHGCADEGGMMVAGNVTEKLEGMGITVLRNEAVELSDSIVLAGVDDYFACESDYATAKNGTGRYPVRILLTHNQEAIPGEELGYWDLALFAHTHCGQVRLPAIGSIPRLFGLKGEYDMGHHIVNGTHVYTTCGVGGYPLRFLAPPEVSVLELH